MCVRKELILVQHQTRENFCECKVEGKYITVTGLCVHFSHSKAHSTTTIS